MADQEDNISNTSPESLLTSPSAKFIAEAEQLVAFGRAFVQGYVLLRKTARAGALCPQAANGQGFTADEIEKLPHERLQRLLKELVLTKLADNYLNFLIDMLALVLRTKPEILRSGDQERVDFILQF